MALKYRVKTLDDVPEALRAEYVEQNGEYVLGVEGAVGKEKVDEFRSNNVELKRQLEEREKAFEGIDPERYRELDAKAQRERDKKMIDAGRMDELVAERVAAMKGDYDKQIAAAVAEKAKLEGELGTLVIDNAIRDAATKAGVRASATEDVLLRGRSLFKLIDGKAVPMDGDKAVFGKTGEPMSIAEWVSGLPDKAPHFFEPSQGSGSRKVEMTGGATGGRINARDTKAFLANVDNVAAGKAQASL